MSSVLITGTTSGIGKAFAEKFASKGHSLILVSRNAEKLQAQKDKLQAQFNVSVKTIACDLSTDNAVTEIQNKLNEWGIVVDILINNAGFNEYGLFANTDIAKELEMINLHISFTTKLIKYLLPNMLKNHYGRILNVGSTGSFIASPTDAVYSATKAYILSFSNALCGELAKTGVKVTTLCPGATRTEFAQKANIQNSLLFKFAVMKPEKVVKIVYPKLMKGKRLVIAGAYNKAMVLCSKILPVRLLNKITIYMMRNRQS